MRTTVLIVEGDAADRAALVILLEGAGYAVDAVSGGQAALAYLHARPAPALILLNVVMAEADAWQFLAVRRGEPALAAIPVVVLSAAGKALRPAALALAADDFLDKPTDPGKLLAIVERYCERGARSPLDGGAQC